MVPELPVLAITLGDPTGIGPEIVTKALTREKAWEGCLPIVVGSHSTLERAQEATGTTLRMRPIGSVDEARHEVGTCNLIDLERELPEPRPAQGSSGAGSAAYAYLERGARLALHGQVAGIVTAPLNKAALSLAGHVGVGHTEVLADLCGVARDDVTMLLASSRLRVAHVSTHVSLREAVALVRTERVVTVGRLAGEAAQRLLGRAPRIALAGLNPHAGEHGLFGDEDDTQIAPAAAALVSEGWDVVGPTSPDTVFLRAVNGEFDVVVAMYHDQGHIPSKLVGFHDTVNVTLGLPIVRTSVDHGTAYDIAGTGTADETNLLAALELARDLGRNAP